MTTAARVLLVCTANQCRSPMAELMFRRALAQVDSGVAWEVTSAGTHAADGVPIHPRTADVMVARGIATDGFRSRRLTAAMIAESDLVLTAERTHRAAVVSLVPQALHRAFTLCQFARLVDAAPPPDAASTGTPLEALVDMARKARSLSTPTDDDLEDPISGRRLDMEAAADRIESAIASIIRALPGGYTDADRGRPVAVTPQAV